MTLTDNCKRWIWTVIVVAVNLTLWILPSRVAYLIAQNRDVLLGRYSVERLTLLLFLLPVSVISLFLTWSPPEKKKQREFKVWAVVLSTIVSLVIVDTAARLMPKQYVVEQSFLSRIPNEAEHGVFKDVPDKAYAYASNPPAYPDIEYTLTTDSRGFRNATTMDHCDLVTIGDSFTEGSNVTDNEIWPVLLSKATNLSVCNLGMSAGNCVSYLETLQRIGVGLSPKTVICMIYEGNDLRDSNYRNRGSLGERIGNYIDSSPIRLAVRTALIKVFGASEAPGSVSSDNEGASVSSAISWLPVAIGPDDNPHYYAFTVKRLLDHCVTAEKFARHDACIKTLEKIQAMNKICRDKGIRLIIAYAPDKSRVIAPLLKSRISAEQLHDFMSLAGRSIPPADQIEGLLAQRLDVQVTAIGDFCRKQSIEFVDLTEPLRTALAAGQQAYFTYDQHWTPVGHKIVAGVFEAYLAGGEKTDQTSAPAAEPNATSTTHN